MLSREDALIVAGQKPPRGLVYPVLYSDGKHFDKRAKATQYRRDLSAYTYPYPGFRESAAYLQFHDSISAMAQEIEDHLETIPAWSPNWPVVVAPPATPRRVGLARL